MVKARRARYQDLSKVYQQTRTSNGDIIDITLEDFNRAYLEAQTAEVRKALKGTGGYRTRWPKVRYNRKGAKSSRLMFRVQTKIRVRAGIMWIMVRHRQRHGHLLETQPTIRGYENRHYHAAMRTIEDNWQAINRVAAAATERRARSRAVRRFHAQQRAAQRAEEVGIARGRAAGM